MEIEGTPSINPFTQNTPGCPNRSPDEQVQNFKDMLSDFIVTELMVKSEKASGAQGET